MSCMPRPYLLYNYKASFFFFFFFFAFGTKDLERLQAQCLLMDLNVYDKLVAAPVVADKHKKPLHYFCCKLGGYK
jgi:hypothetical protein